MTPILAQSRLQSCSRKTAPEVRLRPGALYPRLLWQRKETELALLEQRWRGRGHFFQGWGELEGSREGCWGEAVIVRRPSGLADCHLWKSDSYLPQRPRWPVSSHESLQVLDKVIPGLRKIYILEGRGRIYNKKFSKVDALRKGRSGAPCQEETCLKFGPAEGTYCQLGRQGRHEAGV